ncbi:Charged multivesicular body protein 4c [Dissostichus eleginoides]|uniref:Charged multivesicular body protein 4c n=1 Tax=Dissostichus eleginoides TaxID=100907 RepID=A0AAD9BKA7_DISEL|nr:Charged multivesicular body protein 4c [Dissostichus eleginoides]
MSKIAKLFKGSSSSGSSSSSKSKHSRSRGGPSPQEAIHKLRETEEMLTKKQDYLEKRIEQELAIAKKNGTKNKRGTNTHTYVYTFICIHMYVSAGVYFWLPGAQYGVFWTRFKRNNTG